MAASEGEPIARAGEAWEATTLADTLARQPERKETFVNQSGMALKRLYTPEDVEDLDYLRDLGFPGQYPYTRGAYATMYRGRTWSKRQIVGMGTPKEANARLRSMVDQGMSALSFSPDMNITFGHDPDEPEIVDIVGRIGAIMPSLREWEIYLEGIPLDQLTVSVNETACGIVSFCMYLAVAEKAGVKPEALNGTLQHDVLNMFHAEPFPWLPVEPAMRITMDLFKYTVEHMPKWNPVLINGYNTHEAGATPLQELAFMMADAICYTEEAIKAGLTVDEIAPKYAFYFGIGTSFFEEIAKTRAARHLWAKIVRERFGAQDPESGHMRYHVQTQGSTMTAQQPLNNIARGTIQGLAAVLGGCNSLHICSMDEAYAAPTELAANTSLRTQLILEHETGVADVVDPLAGSYYVESLTKQMIEGAERIIAEIDEFGGTLEGVRSGYFTQAIAESAFQYHSEIERGERLIVGVNAATSEEEVPFETYRPDPATVAEAIDDLHRLRETRDQVRWRKALEDLRDACHGDGNLVPPVLEACKAYATYREIADVLKAEFGEYEYPAIV